jgi:hypothetical protein
MNQVSEKPIYRILNLVSLLALPTMQLLPSIIFSRATIASTGTTARAIPTGQQRNYKHTIGINSRAFL